LLRAGQPRDAVAAFGELPREWPSSALVPQALAGEVRAREALGDRPGAEPARQRLLQEFPHTLWARQLRERGGAP
jgi:TolA-binding protein